MPTPSQHLDRLSSRSGNVNANCTSATGRTPRPNLLRALPHLPRPRLRADRIRMIRTPSSSPRPIARQNISITSGTAPPKTPCPPTPHETTPPVPSPRPGDRRELKIRVGSNPSPASSSNTPPNCASSSTASAPRCSAPPRHRPLRRHRRRHPRHHHLLCGVPAPNQPPPPPRPAEPAANPPPPRRGGRIWNCHIEDLPAENTTTHPGTGTWTGTPSAPPSKPSTTTLPHRPNSTPTPTAPKKPANNHRLPQFHLQRGIRSFAPCRNLDRPRFLAALAGISACPSPRIRNPPATQQADLSRSNPHWGQLATCSPTPHQTELKEKDGKVQMDPNAATPFGYQVLRQRQAAVRGMAPGRLSHDKARASDKAEAQASVKMVAVSSFATRCYPMDRSVP